MSEEWNKKDDSQKIPYAKLAEQDKIRYEREKKIYEKNSNSNKSDSQPKNNIDKKMSKTAKNSKKKITEESEEKSGEEKDDEDFSD